MKIVVKNLSPIVCTPYHLKFTGQGCSFVACRKTHTVTLASLSGEIWNYHKTTDNLHVFNFKLKVDL